MSFRQRDSHQIYQIDQIVWPVEIGPGLISRAKGIAQVVDIGVLLDRVTEVATRDPGVSQWLEKVACHNCSESLKRLRFTKTVIESRGLMIVPVLLCGGAGSRLWPLSRKSFPKQFVRMVSNQSLFQAAVQRFSGSGFSDPLIITGEPFRFVVTEQLDEIHVAASGIMIEPFGRNTAPAALLAALHVAKTDPEGILLLAPSDHAVDDDDDFRAAVLKGKAAAEEGRIVTFGVKPTQPATGYGWIETSGSDETGTQDLKRFVEKPALEVAQEMLEAGHFLWNSGVFLAKAKCLIDACRQHAPEVLDAVQSAFESVEVDQGISRICSDSWSAVPDISIDYAVMEKAANLSVVKLDGGWSDLGDWNAVLLGSNRDETGNSSSGNVTALDCKNSLLRSESENVELVCIGLDNLVAVAMHDAVMVADLSKTQNVKKAVEVLQGRGVKQAEHFPVDYRPWGFFETLILADRFQVKRICVHPGASLSLQSHVHRSEHWIVVAGTAKVTVDDDVKLLTENQSVYIPLGAVHRLENPGKIQTVLIEVQTGAYLEEDDITRYEDLYDRS